MPVLLAFLAPPMLVLWQTPLEHAAALALFGGVVVGRGFAAATADASATPQVAFQGVLPLSASTAPLPRTSAADATHTMRSSAESGGEDSDGSMVIGIIIGAASAAVLFAVGLYVYMRKVKSTVPPPPSQCDTEMGIVSLATHQGRGPNSAAAAKALPSHAAELDQIPVAVAVSASTSHIKDDL